MKKILMVALAVSAVLALFAGPAAAQYGPKGTIVLDNPTATPGSEVNVTVTGCNSGEDVVVTVNPTYNGVADDDGTAVIPIVAPDEPGTYTVTSTCGSLVQTATLTVVGVTAAGVGTLPRTGSDSLPLAQIGAVLVALGGLSVLVARKRTTA